MLKGIVALFTSGLFFHPMVLSAIALGIWVSSQFKSEEIYEALRFSYFYIAAVVWAFAYTFLFAKVYKEGGVEVDKLATFFKGIGNTIKFIAAFFLTLAFMVSWIF